MTKVERNEIAKILLVLAELYNRQVSKDSVIFMLNQLEELSFNEIKTAITKYTRDPNNRNFPMPAQIIAIARPEISSKENAIDVANLIVQAMSKYGWTNPEKAKSFMGELAWEVVEREGGWQRVCETSTDDQLAFLKSQWRELARVLLNKNAIGKLNERPSLNNPEKAISLEFKK